MDDINKLNERVAELELHREYDVKLNEAQTKKLDQAVAEIREIYIGLQWIIRIGKFLTAVSALILTWIGIKNGMGFNG